MTGDPDTKKYFSEESRGRSFIIFFFIGFYRVLHIISTMQLWRFSLKSQIITNVVENFELEANSAEFWPDLLQSFVKFSVLKTICNLMITVNVVHI